VYRWKLWGKNFFEKLYFFKIFVLFSLMLGEFVDDYTVRVIDVFAMPQSGTGVSVEAVDPVFQAKMLDMLKQTGRPEMVVGWYHSHPGFGCWLSGVDINTQQSFEALTERTVVGFFQLLIKQKIFFAV
jgi:26S proteasome regulatory subunit N11